MRRQILPFGLVLALSLISWTLLAQDETPPAPPVPTASQDVATVADQPAAEAAYESSPPRERIVYIPFSVLEGAFENPDANVVLPYAEYIRLRQEWEKSQVPKAAPAAVISQANYVATVEGDLVKIVATLSVNVLGEAWSEVPLHFGDAAVAAISGEQVLLRGTGDGTYSLLLGKTGEQVVTIELAARVLQSPAGRELQLKIPQVGVSTLELVVPNLIRRLKSCPGCSHSRPRILRQARRASRPALARLLRSPHAGIRGPV